MSLTISVVVLRILASVLPVITLLAFGVLTVEVIRDLVDPSRYRNSMTQQYYQSRRDFRIGTAIGAVASFSCGSLVGWLLYWIWTLPLLVRG